MEVESEADITEASTTAGATVQSSRSVRFVKRSDKEYVTENLVGQNGMEAGLQYRAPWYCCNLSDDTHTFAKLLAQPFTDRYQRAIQKKRQCFCQSQRQ